MLQKVDNIYTIFNLYEIQLKSLCFSVYLSLYNTHYQNEENLSLFINIRNLSIKFSIVIKTFL